MNGRSLPVPGKRIFRWSESTLRSEIQMFLFGWPVYIYIATIQGMQMNIRILFSTHLLSCNVPLLRPPVLNTITFLASLAIQLFLSLSLFYWLKFNSLHWFPWNPSPFTNQPESRCFPCIYMFYLQQYLMNSFQWILFLNHFCINQVKGNAVSPFRHPNDSKSNKNRNETDGEWRGMLFMSGSIRFKNSYWRRRSQ